jgi:hypothetical protein
MLETLKEVLKSRLEAAKDPADIEAFTNGLKDIETAEKADKDKDDLINRQASNIKKLVLNEPLPPNKVEKDADAGEEEAPKDLDKIIANVLAERKKN